MHHQPKFTLGNVVATPGALRLLAKHQQLPHTFLKRHARGDWGEVGEEDSAANERALLDGSRLLSAYPLGNRRLWLITEADRSVTTLLLPEEY